MSLATKLAMQEENRYMWSCYSSCYFSAKNNCPRSCFKNV